MRQKNPVHVLLIEPDTILANTYARALERQGYTVSRAASAQTAVHVADERQPDVVVLELQLPRHNGVEFLYEFRSYSEWRDIPIIIHTFIPLAELAAAETLRAELGVKRLLYKPDSSLRQLCAAVRDAAAVTA